MWNTFHVILIKRKTTEKGVRIKKSVIIWTWYRGLNILANSQKKYNTSYRLVPCTNTMKKDLF